jgi:hypothetical protein
MGNRRFQPQVIFSFRLRLIFSFGKVPQRRGLPAEF